MSEPSEAELLDVAHEAARAGAVELMARFGQQAQGVESKSTPTDLVSAADLAAERVIREVLGRRRPEDRVLGEEGGETGQGRLRWVVDPLDGTTNFLFGIPAFSVSIACEDDLGAIAGVVLDPVRDELFAAVRSGPATLNGSPIHGSGRDQLSTALVATGFGYSEAVRLRQAAVVARLLPRVRDIRRFGSAALDLSWCACGRFDAYYERGVNAWDIAAGALIASRAGLVVRPLGASSSSEDDPAGLLVAPPAIADALYELVA